MAASTLRSPRLPASRVRSATATLSPSISLRLSPTTLLAATATTSTDLATPTLLRLVRLCTRGKPSPAMPLPLPTTLLAATATTSTAPATPTLTDPPRVSTRGLPPLLTLSSTPLLMALTPTMAASTLRSPRLPASRVRSATGTLSPSTSLRLSPTILLAATATTSTDLATPTSLRLVRLCTRGKPSPAIPLPLLTTLLAATATTSTAPAIPTLTDPPRVSTRGLPPLPTLSSTPLLMALIPMMAASTLRSPRLPASRVRSATATLSPSTSLRLSPTTLLAATATTSMDLATPMSPRLVRLCTRGKPSPAMPLPLPTTLLAATATTSTAPATPTLTGLPRVSTRGRPLVPATRPWSVAT